MAEVIWTEPALWSLDEIGDYIAIDNPEAATKVIIIHVERAERDFQLKRITKND